MNNLTGAALGICTAFVFMGAVQMIAPGGAMKKSISYLLGLAFLVIILISALAIGKFDISVNGTSQVETENIPAMAGGAAKYLCESALKSHNISFKNITVNADICEDGSISIIRVRVVSAHSKAEIAAALEGLVPESELEVINE